MTSQARIMELLTKVCAISREAVRQELDYSAEVREILRLDANNRYKTRLLFPEVLTALSFQGIGDRVVLGYIEAHGQVTYFQIARRLKGHRRQYGRLCRKLQSFDSYNKCNYRKAKLTCNNPVMLMRCPVRRHDLLKGVLNIKAYSLFFYIRDVCQGDLIGHFDQIIQGHYRPDSRHGTWVLEAKTALVKDFKRVFGIGDKLANMTLSFLLSADPDNPTWVRVGQSMVAVDSLVHNFLHRTGMLQFYQADHKYGPGCSIHCLRVLDMLTREIDARQFNPTYPSYFPRFVQYSIWRFCSVMVEGICNGVKIDDTRPCDRQDICPVYYLCDHFQLKGG